MWNPSLHLQHRVSPFFSFKFESGQIYFFFCFLSAFYLVASFFVFVLRKFLSRSSSYSSVSASFLCRCSYCSFFLGFPLKLVPFWNSDKILLFLYASSSYFFSFFLFLFSRCDFYVCTSMRIFVFHLVRSKAKMLNIIRSKKKPKSRKKRHKRKWETRTEGTDNDEQERGRRRNPCWTSSLATTRRERQ
jgi:hypothetical protein